MRIIIYVDQLRKALMPVTRQVHRHGTTFTERFWIKPEEAKHIFRLKIGESQVPVKSKPGTFRPVPQFSFLHGEKGDVTDPETLDRIKTLKIPPNVTNVRINPDPQAPLQALWSDAKGRTVYRYSEKHIGNAAAKKWERIAAFPKELPKIQRTIAKDLQHPDSKIRDAAAILYLIDKTTIRIGSNRDTKAKEKAYGASTLLGKHVQIVGDRVNLEFTGKKGVTIRKSVPDPMLAKILAERKKTDNEPLFSVSDGFVRAYLKKINGPHHIHDFRGFYGTSLAEDMITSKGIPKTPKEMSKWQNEIGDTVATLLGNTRAVALKDYINPAVWRKWEEKLKAPTTST